MAMQFWEQNNFRDGIMTDGMTGRNETELYQRSVQDMVDCMPTPFGSVKNDTIFLDKILMDASGNALGRTDTVRWNELFYGVLSNHSTYGHCTVVFIPYDTYTFFAIIKNGVLIFAAEKTYVIEKTFFQLENRFYFRIGGVMRIANEWGDILDVYQSYAFFDTLPTQKSVPLSSLVGTGRAVRFLREAGSGTFSIELTPGDYYLSDGVIEINGGKGILFSQTVTPTVGYYYFRVVDSLFPGDTSRVDSTTGNIITDWKTWGIASIFYEPYITVASLVQATEMVFWNSRLVLAGVPGYESRLFISKTALYGNFSNYQNNADEAIQSDVGFRSQINHIISYDQLMVFTEQNMYFTKFDTGTTPTSFSLRIGTDVSATDDIRPTILNENLVFVNINKDKIVLLNPNYSTYNYDYINLTLQLYGKLGQIYFISKSNINTDFLNNHLIIEAEKGRFLLQLDRNENIISYTRVDNGLGTFKTKIVDENNEEWFFVSDGANWNLHTIKLGVSSKMIIKLHQQRIWFDGRTKHYYDKNMKSKALKIYYRGNLRFYYRGQEIFSEDFAEEARDPEAPKLFQTTQVLWNYDEYVTIENRSEEPFELHSVVVGVV